jgi:hypothetical protein
MFRVSRSIGEPLDDVEISLQPLDGPQWSWWIYVKFTRPLIGVVPNVRGLAIELEGIL